MSMDREEMEMLLPWYVNGTLDAESRREIDAALKTDAKLRRALAVAREEQDAVTVLNEEVAPPSSAVLDKIMNEVKASGRASYASAKRSLAEGFKAFVTSLSPRNLALAAGGVACLVIVQAVTIGYHQYQDSGYGLASEQHHNGAKGPRFIVQFAPGATAEQIAAVLDKLDLVIVDGPNGGLFIVASRAAKPDQAAGILQQLQSSHDVVAFSANAPTGDN